MARSNILNVHGARNSAAKTLSLHGHSVERIYGAFPYCIEVLEGIAYVTREGDSADYVVPANGHLKIDGPGSVVVEGFPNAEVKVSA